MATSWSGLYLDFSIGMTDYITRHVQNYTRIQYCLDYVYAMSGGSTALADVPNGLLQIFDRRGLIGANSYSFPTGELTGPAYNLVFQPGAYWSGGYLRFINATTTISMAGKESHTYYINIDSGGNPSISDTPGADAVWSFDWNGTNTVSNKTLLDGTSILFSGHDFADCLTSAVLTQTFMSLADRLENAEGLITAGYPPGDYAYDNINSNGLHFYYKAGRVREDNQISITAAGHIDLTGNSNNYIEVSPRTGVVYTNTTGFTQGRVPLHIVVCAVGSITTVTDKRCWLDGRTYGGILTGTPGANVTIDWSKGKKYTLLLNRATTNITFTGAANGDTLVLILVQDGVGGRNVTFTSEVRGGSDLTLPPVLSIQINKTDYLGFICQAAGPYYDYVSLSRGF